MCAKNEKEVKNIKLHLDFSNPYVCKKLETARQKLIPIQPILEQLIIMSDLSSFENKPDI